MTIGIALQKANLDADMGNAALHLVTFLRMTDQLHETLLIASDAELKALGYTDGTNSTPNEIATIKSAWNNDAVLIANLVRGLATLGAAQDLRANLFQMVGTGVA